MFYFLNVTVLKNQYLNATNTNNNKKKKPREKLRFCQLVRESKQELIVIP